MGEPFYCLGDAFSDGLWEPDSVAAIMLERRADIKTCFCMGIPGFSVFGLDEC
jgi:hypothetical protein